jgi:hypothetical protein
VPPFKPGAIDLAFCSQTLHHLPEEMIPAFLAALARLGRQGALLMDLEREFRPGPPPGWARGCSSSDRWCASTARSACGAASR